MKIRKKKVYNKWTEYSLINDRGITVSFLNFGGIITKVMAPDKDERFENIVLGYKNYQDYEQNPNYLGTLIGRVAGRIENGRFSLNGKTHQLDVNGGVHHLHGGSSGLHQVVWEVETFEYADRIGARLVYDSPDGEGGYPGDVHITVTYTLTNNNQFIIDYAATTNEATIFSMTNHSYFNLTGNLKGTVEDHYVQLDADSFAELGRSYIATGKLLSVAGTPFDFRKGEYLRVGMTSNDEQTKLVNNGYDHYFLLNNETSPQVIVTEPRSGRVLTLDTNNSGIVLYTSNSMSESLRLRERMARQYLGLCLETQEHVASLKYNHFPSVIINENNPYHKQAVYSFETRDM